MDCGDAALVWQDGDGGDHVVDICPARLAMLVVRQFDADQQFSEGDRGDCGVIVIRDEGAEVPSPLYVDEEGRVEQETSQRRSSICRSDRLFSTSSDHCSSILWRAKSSFTSAPRPRCAGSRCATAFPRRTIVKCSPRSTASRRSAKFLAASVAVMSLM